MLKIYKWCHLYPALKCRELLNRGVLNRRDRCIYFLVVFDINLMSHYVVCWRVGFSLSQRVFLVWGFGCNTRRLLVFNGITSS